MPDTAPLLRYRSLDEVLGSLTTAPGQRVRALYTQLASEIARAPGSKAAHQAWPGGCVGHVLDTINIGLAMYDTLRRTGRSVDFTEEDVVIVLLLHDVEKPARYLGLHRSAQGEKGDRAHYRQYLLAHYGIVLSEPQQNAVRYCEGEGNDYRPGHRVMNGLAALCHAADVLSARLWHDYPRRDDPWTGAEVYGDPSAKA